MSRSSAGNVGIPTTMGASVGKYYFEVYWNNDTQVGNYMWGFILPDSNIFGSAPANQVPTTYALQNNSGDTYLDSVIITMNGTDPTTGTIIGVAIDFDNGKIFYGQDGGSGSRSMNWNNSATGTGVPASGTNPAHTFTAGSITLIPAFSISSIGDTNWILNFGQSSAFSGALTSQGNTDGNGQGDFYYSPPTGFTGWTTGGLQTADAIDPAQTDDDYPQELFFMSQYAGNLAGRTITTENQPDLIFIRAYNQSQNWYVVDSSRVITDNKYWLTNSSDPEDTLPQANFTSVGATSVGISSGTWLNSTGSNMQMWMWRMNGGTTSSNTLGDVTSTVQVDPTGNMSIITYTGTGVAGDTVGHGLSQAPDFFIIKRLNTGDNNMVAARAYPNNANDLRLDVTGAGGATSLFPSGESFDNVTATLYPMASNVPVNASGSTYVGYFFSNCEGFIKSAMYEGNADADGTFVYTGFRPALIICKSFDSISNWILYDDKREGYNVDNDSLIPNETTAGATTDMIDILSNGFKLRISTLPNAAETYFYMAWASNPFAYATAR